MINSSDFLQQAQARVNTALSHLLAEQCSIYADANNSHLIKLKAACSYSISNGGKRLRPALFYATTQTFNHQCHEEDLDK